MLCTWLLNPRIYTKFYFTLEYLIYFIKKFLTTTPYNIKFNNLPQALIIQLFFQKNKASKTSLAHVLPDQ